MGHAEESKTYGPVYEGDAMTWTPLLIVAGNKENSPKALKILRRKRISFLYIPCWKTMVKVPEEIADCAVVLANDVRKRDKTFRWKIIRSYHRDVNIQKCKLLVIYSPTKNQAYRRGSYFLHKLELKKFERLKKGYYWVKEYPSNLHAVDSQTGEIRGEDDILSEVKKILAIVSMSNRDSSD